MKRSWLLAAGVALALASGPAGAQQPDYLTPEEVEKVRETQEPNQRIGLFLDFAAQRLSAFEKALVRVPGQEPPDPELWIDLLNNFIRAVDDDAEALEQAMGRGGVDLRKTRTPLGEKGEDFLARLERIQQTNEAASEDLRYGLEDAVEATRDLVALGKTIPDAPIPPKSPAGVATTTPSEPEAPPGRPTLKRKKEDKPQ